MWSHYDKKVLPIVLVAMIAISIIMGFIFRNKSRAVKQIPLTCIAVFLIVFEIVKITYNLSAGTWENRMIPLHFCSLFLFWFAFSAFGRGWLKRMGDTLGFVSCIMLIIMFYIFPDAIIGSASKNFFKGFNHAHTFVFHHLVIQYFLLVIALKLYTPKMKDFIYILVGLSIYFVIFVPVAYLAKANFNNILVSDVKILNDLRVHFNGLWSIKISGKKYGVGFPLAMYAGGMSLAIIIHFVVNGVYKLIEIINKKFFTK